MAWASGSVPRTMSVKVWARAMACMKLVTGNWYSQGMMALWLAFTRMPFTPTACSFSCYGCLVSQCHRRSGFWGARCLSLTFTTAVRESMTYFLSNGAMDAAS